MSKFNREKSLKLSENHKNESTQRDYLAPHMVPLLWSAAKCKTRPDLGCSQKLPKELLS